MSAAKLEAFRAFDFEGDERWRAFRRNLEIPPGKEALEIKFRAKWYKRVIDEDFDVSLVAPPPATAPAPTPTPPSAAPRASAGAGTAPASGAAGSQRGASGAAAGSVRGGPATDLVLLVAHVVMLASAVVSLQPLNRYLAWQAYFLFARTALVAAGYKIYLRMGLPAVRPLTALMPWMQQLTTCSEFFHFMLATLLLQVPQLWSGMFPVALSVVTPTLAALAARFPAHPLWERYGRRAKEVVDGSQATIGKLSANLEIALGLQFVFVVLSMGLRGAMLAMVYWQNLRVRYWAPESRPHHLQAWANLHGKVQPLLNMVPALQRYLDYAVRWFQQPGQQQPHRS